MEEVAGDAAVDGAAPCRLGTERWQHRENVGGAKDKGNVGAAPWRWRTGWLNQRDNEIDDGSSSGTVDEGRRGVAVDDVVGEEAPAGWRTEQGVGFRRGFSWPRCTNWWADGMGTGTMA